MPHPTDRPRWIQYDPSAQLAILGAFSRDAELAHRRLTDFHWETGRWVRTDRPRPWVLPRVAARRWPAVLHELAVLGWQEKRGALVNPSVHRVRARAVDALKLASDAGHKGAQRRWAGGLARQPACVAEAPAQLGPASATPARRRPAGVAEAPAQPGPASATGDPAGDPTADPNRVLNRDPNADKDKDKNEISPLPNSSLAVNAERSTLSVSPLQKATEPEEKFLADVFGVICEWNPAGGRLELVNWGGWWRNRFREDPDKARRVLAEINSMIKEHRILENPGAAAADLWKRLP